MRQLLRHTSWHCLMLALALARPCAGQSMVTTSTITQPEGETLRGLIPKLHARLGRPFKPDEQSAISAAGNRQDQELRNSHQAFVHDVARITGVPVPSIAAMPAADPASDTFYKTFIPKLEQHRTRKLTTFELQQIRLADEKKKNAVQPIRMRYAAEIARITGLPVSDVIDMLPKFNAKNVARGEPL